jgi:hypothetical protein
LDTRHRKIDRGTIEHKTQKDRHDDHWTLCVLCSMLHVSIFLCLVPNVNRVYLSVSCVQCCPYLSFCVLRSMLPVSIFLCLVSNATRVYLSVSCVQCYPCLSFCVLCPMLPVSIFLCLVSNTIHRQKTQVTLNTRHRKIDTGNIGQKTKKDRDG